MTGFVDHAEREIVRSEIHARPIVPVAAKTRVRRLVFGMPAEPAAYDAALTGFAQWAAAHGVQIAPHARHAAIGLPDLTLIFERHTEFVTLTWQQPGSLLAPLPGEGAAPLLALPLLQATQIDLLEGTQLGPDLLDRLDPVSLCYSRVLRGAAELATDLRCDAEGYTTYLCAAGQLDDVERGFLVRRVLEIETYRAVALLGLSPARSHAGALAAMEKGLSLMLDQLARAHTQADNKAVLEALQGLQMEAAQLAEATRYRFAASYAYESILNRRLARLDESPVRGTRTLTTFLTHRIEPAVETMRAFERRLSGVDARISGTTEMLNTRISLDIQAQNQTLFGKLSDTAQSQYRLQLTVEGLSAIAISYYLLGILSYVLSGLSSIGHFDKTLVIGLSAPFVVALVWLALRRIRHRAHPK